ncbi:MAG: winged helix-turn-helix transcriptional regulator [Actinobacteria bacterium]|jgi:ArsR family transcriptional regulator|nr:winged helix-turn-helix transcriptional regulator [Actinomycetota bacterium]MBE3114720.1 winged helix-turn-helix transcriptional regulator [Actinomycetota bacterium]
MSTFKKITRVLKALADENRIRILYLLSERKDLCVCEIREVIGLSQPTISSHLKLLENNELVTFNKDGKWVNYSMNPDLNVKLKQMLNDIFSMIKTDSEVKKDRIRVYKIDRRNLCKS